MPHSPASSYRRKRSSAPIGQGNAVRASTRTTPQATGESRRQPPRDDLPARNRRSQDPVAMTGTAAARLFSRRTDSALAREVKMAHTSHRLFKSYGVPDTTDHHRRPGPHYTEGGCSIGKPSAFGTSRRRGRNSARPACRLAWATSGVEPGVRKWRTGVAQQWCGICWPTTLSAEPPSPLSELWKRQ